MAKLGAGKSSPEEIHLFVFSEIPVEVAAAELILWEHGAWYPKDCPVRYVRETSGELQVGTLYAQTITKPFPVKNLLEVTRFVPGRVIERTYRKGILKGIERISIEERANGTRIDYDLHYMIPNPVDRLLWQLFYRKQLEATIDKVLKTIKEALQKKIQQHNEGGTEQT